MIDNVGVTFLVIDAVTRVLPGVVLIALHPGTSRADGVVEKRKITDVGVDPGDQNRRSTR